MSHIWSAICVDYAVCILIKILCHLLHGVLIDAHVLVYHVSHVVLVYVDEVQNHTFYCVHYGYPNWKNT